MTFQLTKAFGSQLLQLKSLCLHPKAHKSGNQNKQSQAIELLVNLSYPEDQASEVDIILYDYVKSVANDNVGM